jgi:hypothetical protein
LFIKERKRKGKRRKRKRKRDRASIPSSPRKDCLSFLEFVRASHNIDSSYDMRVSSSSVSSFIIFGVFPRIT